FYNNVTPQPVSHTPVNGIGILLIPVYNRRRLTSLTTEFSIPGQMCLYVWHSGAATLLSVIIFERVINILLLPSRVTG
ncbi:hypothetical protein, partial [Escherichia sp. 92.1228]|uniref:hypothetical protein n=1 Tax=Escherichia sp. 92.1228 TaxID=2723304 RepID=UPI001A90F7C9